MRQTPAVSRPAGMRVISGGGSGRRSPVEAVASAAVCVTRTPVADWPGLRGGRFGRWTDGATAMRGDCAAFASHWQEHNGKLASGFHPSQTGYRDWTRAFWPPFRQQPAHARASCTRRERHAACLFTATLSAATVWLPQANHARSGEAVSCPEGYAAPAKRS